MRPEGQPEATRIRKHSLVVAGHKTSVSLENAFWAGLRSLADEGKTTVAGLVTTIDEARGGANLSSAIRVFVLTRLGGRPSA